VCDVLLKDSHAYLDHLNGKWHNRALGMSMKVDKSTTEQVRARLQDAKRKKDLGILGSNTEVAVEDRLHYHLPDGMSRAEVEKEGFQEEGEDEQEDEKGDMAAMMGFSGFCGGKND
jgi:U4/U6.U5 tri-snRNP component SNU23